jgi:hypothetical protein
MSSDRRPLTEAEIRKVLPESWRTRIEREERLAQGDREARRTDIAAELRTMRAAGDRDAAERLTDWDRATAEVRKAEAALSVARDAEHRAKCATFNAGLSRDHVINKLEAEIRDLADPKWLVFAAELDDLETKMRDVHVESHSETRQAESMSLRANAGLVRKLTRLFSNRPTIERRYAAIREAQAAVRRGIATVGIDVEREITRVRSSIPAIGPSELVYDEKKNLSREIA